MRRTVPIGVLGVVLAAFVVAPTGGSARPDPAQQGVQAAGARSFVLPVVFEPNVGQAPAQVRYLTRSSRSSLSLLVNGAELALQHGSVHDVVGLRFLGSAPDATISASGRLSGASNYMIGSDPAAWRTRVPNFASVHYQGLYPGIGINFHGSSGARLEYDFHLAEGADPNRIQLGFDGVNRLSLTSAGDLVLHLAGGSVLQPRPLAWQGSGVSRRSVGVAYRISGATVGFRLGAYDPAQPIVIDPKIVYSTYWGGSSFDGTEVAVDRNGFMYIACGTGSPDLRNDNGLYPYQGGEDACVAKLDPSGTTVIYSTYLGSVTGDDEADSIAVDGRGQAYVGGFASAQDFPTTPGAYDTTFNGGSFPGCTCFGDLFVSKLSADGQHLLYSTFIGGSDAEAIRTLALDPRGGLVLTGFTGSTDFPVTPGALQSTFGGGTGTFEDIPVDSFAAKLNPSGSKLVYATYLGGSGDDVGNAVATDGQGNAYYAGFTESPEFPTTPGALKTEYGNPPPILNGYVTKLDQKGSVVWSTYLGGPTRDSAWGIGVDAHHDVFVSGSSIGDFPVTPGAYDTSFNGIRDWFAAKIDRSGSSLEWATYLGGSDYDGLSADMRLDGHGHMVITGPTASTDFPTTKDAFQPANAGGFDYALVELNLQGRLRFSSYLGGSGDEDNFALSTPAIDHAGNVYMGGYTTSVDFPTTPDAIQPAFGGDDIDGVLVKIDLHRCAC